MKNIQEYVGPVVTCVFEKKRKIREELEMLKNDKERTPAEIVARCQILSERKEGLDMIAEALCTHSHLLDND